MRWLGERRLHWQLLGVVALVVALAGLAAGFGLVRVSDSTAAYAALVRTTFVVARQADELNAQFISRHKVLKDIYLFDADAQKVQTYTNEVAASDLEVSTGLGALQANTSLRPDEQQLVTTAVQALTNYNRLSQQAIARINAGGDPYETQQAAALLTMGQDRPISAALAELSARLNERAQAESVGLEAQSQRTELAAVGVLAGALVLGFALAARLARGITRTARSIEAAAVALASAGLEERTAQAEHSVAEMQAVIAERTQAEEALRASEQRFRLALQAASMGTWDVDFVRGVHTWSTETEALFGLAPGTFEGTSAGFRRLVHPDDWAAFEVEDHAAQGEDRVSVTTYRTIWPDGTVHWLEEKGRPQYAADGTLVRMTGTSMDVTERKRAEEALLASEERFRKQYKGFPLPTYSWLRVGDDFVLQDYNNAAEAVTDGTVRDWPGTLASASYADQPQVLADMQACVDAQQTLRREMRYRYRRTGIERELAVTYVFVPPQTVMAHIEDITDAKQAEQQRDALAQSEKLRALGQMATGIAHDLNQSLMLVASYSDLARQALRQAPPNLAELEDLMATTTQAALDGGETVKRLLLFTRAVPEHDTQLVDLYSVVHEAAQLTAPRWRDASQAEGRPIGLKIEADVHPTIQGSAARLRELMTNLIFNAVDALPTGGTIRLRVLAEDTVGVVEVVDSGVGMSAEIQARAFEPFFTTKGESGTGLGLAMVFGIVEQHGGHVALTSAPNVGTTFRLTFPLASAASAADPASSSARHSAPVVPLRVLVVDDEPMMTKAVVRMLRPAGHQVRSAASGEEALDILAAHAIDLVVSDMGMGAGMNGWDLADAVKRRWPGMRFLLATGWGAAIDPAEARAKGVEAVLSKPYRPADLLEALARTDVAA